MKKLLLTCVALAALTHSAHADPKLWTVDPANSTLTFVGDQSGEKFHGGFKNFTAQIVLDPDHPESGKIAVAVDITSAYAGSSDRNGMLPQSDWFNTSKFPTAQFNSTVIRKTGAGQYVADATLTIKGVTKNVSLPFTLVPEGDHMRAQGKLSLMRSDFALGQGSFANENYVKFPVDVIVDLQAK